MPATADKIGLKTTRLADVVPVPVVFLAPPIIPLGKLSLIAGDGSAGKSLLMRHLAAKVSTGKPAFGLTYDPPPAADVLLIGVEDGVEDTLVPSLLALRADRNRVHNLDAAIDAKGRPYPFTVADVPPLASFLAKNPEVRLVIIDPITAYIGAAGLDDNRSAVVQAALGPLAQLAEKHKVAIVLIMHFNKGVTTSAVNRVTNSKAYVNTVRNAWVVIPDPEDAERRLFLPIKRNLPYNPKGIAFHREELDGPEQHEILSQFTKLTQEQLTELGRQLVKVVIDGEVDETADHVLQQSQPRKKLFGTVDKCVEWLREFAGKQAWPCNEIVTAAEGAGFSFNTQVKAKASLKAEGFEAHPLVANGDWWFGKGPKDGWTRRPSPN